MGPISSWAIPNNHGGHVSFADLQHAGYQPVELLETERCVACVALDGGAWWVWGGWNEDCQISDFGPLSDGFRYTFRYTFSLSDCM